MLQSRNNNSRNITWPYPWATDHEVTYYKVLGIIYGILCVIGLSGNAINAVVLGRCGLRRLFRQDRSAHVGFIFLAVADALVCLICFPRSFIPDEANDFDSAGFELYYTLYGAHLAHMFMIMSTWITLQLAVCRCIITYDPIRNHLGRIVTGPKTCITCSAIIVVAILFCSPTYWTLTSNHVELPTNETIFFVDQGKFGDSYTLNVLSWLRFTFGYVFPFIVLLTCNIYLAVWLVRTDRSRQKLTGRPNKINIGSRITPTLMSIIIVFLLLMTPSEILDFIFDSLGSLDNKTNIYILARSLTNVLQVTNYAINFALHIGINRGYRSAVYSILIGFVNAKNDDSHRINGSRTDSKNTTKLFKMNSTPHHNVIIRDQDQNQGLIRELNKGKVNKYEYYD